MSGPERGREADAVTGGPEQGDETRGAAVAGLERGAGAGDETRGTVTVRLARFEGPLDLLLHLIKRDEIDIYDIPIARITEQYLGYLELMRALDLEVAGDFLVMAATLMRIKARLLLPLPAAGEEEDEGDPREELVQRLVEYRQFKQAADTLKGRESDRRLLFERGMVPGEDELGPVLLAPASLFDLLDSLHRVLARLPEPAVYDVQGEVYDVEDQMALIASTVAEQGEASFTDLLARCRARTEMIVTFMALLELIKLGRILVVQGQAFGDIRILHRQPEGSEPHASEPSPSGD